MSPRELLKSILNDNDTRNAEIASYVNSLTEEEVINHLAGI